MIRSCLRRLDCVIKPDTCDKIVKNIYKNSFLILAIKSKRTLNLLIPHSGITYHKIFNPNMLQWKLSKYYFQ